MTSMIEHSSSFKEKTKFSQEKYIKKKKQKLIPSITCSTAVSILHYPPGTFLYLGSSGRPHYFCVSCTSLKRLPRHSELVVFSLGTGITFPLADMQLSSYRCPLSDPGHEQHSCLLQHDCHGNLPRVYDWSDAGANGRYVSMNHRIL